MGMSQVSVNERKRKPGKLENFAKFVDIFSGLASAAGSIGKIAGGVPSTFTADASAGLTSANPLARFQQAQGLGFGPKVSNLASKHSILGRIR